MTSTNNILRCLRSIHTSTYSNNSIEVLIVDGNSTDKTLYLVNKYQKQTSLNIKIIINEKKYQNFGFNKGIDCASGDLIMRLDAHSTINKRYLASSVDYLFNINPSAMAVGCLLTTRPQKNSLRGRGISAVMSSSFGVGRSIFRIFKEIHHFGRVM